MDTQNTPELIPESKSSAGQLIAIVVILIVIVAGGLYFWLQKEDTSTITLPTPQVTEQAPTETLKDIKKDFNTKEFNNIDTLLNDVDAEF